LNTINPKFLPELSTKLTSKQPVYAEQKTNYRIINFDVNVNFKPSDILVKSPDNQGLKFHFGSYNAANTRSFVVQAKPQRKGCRRDWPCYVYL